MANTLGMIDMVIIVVVAVAAIPMNPDRSGATTDQPDLLQVDFHCWTGRSSTPRGNRSGSRRPETDPRPGHRPAAGDRCAERSTGPRARIGGRLVRAPRRDRPPAAPDGDPVTRCGPTQVAGTGFHALPNSPLEQWRGEHVIDKIPGAGHDHLAPARRPDGTVLGRTGRGSSLRRPPGTPRTHHRSGAESFQQPAGWRLPGAAGKGRA